MLKLKSVNFKQQQFQDHCLSQSYPGQTEWLIGRNTNCDLVLLNPEISRVHGRILYSDGSYHYVDIGSTSGSLLNSEPVPVNEKQRISSGDLLQMGETLLYIEELSPPESSTACSTSFSSFAEKAWTTDELLCRCCRIIDETPDVKTFCFVADPPVRFTYQPGQFANLQIEIDGKPVIRPYTISSSPSRPAYLSLTVKRVPSPPDQPDVPAGLVSNWLHDHLREGDRVKLIGGPLGHFTCLPNIPSRLLFISAGSGITPMMSMSRWLQDTFTHCDILFLHSARSPEDIVFRTELEMMTAQMPNFRSAITVTQTPTRQPWLGLTGRISPAMLHLLAPDLMERSVFVCGPDGFMKTIKSMLESLNFPMQNYQEESFGGRKSAPKTAPSRSTELEPLLAEIRQRQSTVNAVMNSAVSSPVNSTFNLNSNSSLNSYDSNNRNGNSNPTVHRAAPDQQRVSQPPTTRQTPLVVTFTKSKQDVPIDGETSILELAEQSGISLPSGCRVGSCGVCKVRTQGGEVRYERSPIALTPTDQRMGYALACVGYPVDQLEVEA